jgi:hypothetical protein
MSRSAAVVPVRQPKPPIAILWGGLIRGTLDITGPIVVYGRYGLKPIPLLQGIAAGLLAARAREGGLPTAWLGLVCHFFIAFGAATVYFTASRWIAFLVQHAVVCGVAFGVAVYFFMNRILVPRSAIGKRPFLSGWWSSA